MLDKNPKGKSTPKHVDIRGRSTYRGADKEWVESPIHNVHYIPESARFNTEDKEWVQSPIHNSQFIPEAARFSTEPSDNECSDNLDSCDEDDGNNQSTVNNMKMCNCVNPLIILGAVVGVFLIIFGNLNGSEVDKTQELLVLEESVKILSKDFPSQVEDFWLFIQVGITDITKFQHPKTILFLYNDQSQNTAEKLLNKISKLGTCALTDCEADPVVLEGSHLNSTDILEDYGKIIANNKKKLEKSGVMIIKNLEKIPGASAQAFHSFCDEINPVVQKALFLFTMKVDQFHENNVEFVEQYLHDLWSDIKDDKFYPLFTRISHVILPIQGE